MSVGKVSQKENQNDCCFHWRIFSFSFIGSYVFHSSHWLVHCFYVCDTLCCSFCGLGDWGSIDQLPLLSWSVKITYMLPVMNMGKCNNSYQFSKREQFFLRTGSFNWNSITPLHSSPLFLPTDVSTYPLLISSYDINQFHTDFFLLSHMQMTWFTHS